MTIILPFPLQSKVIFNIINRITRGRVPFSVNCGDQLFAKDLVVLLRRTLLYNNGVVVIRNFVNDEPGLF